MSERDDRVEKDSMGDVRVPGWALWGAGTQRAVENFPIGDRGLPPEIIHAYGLIKAACAKVNQDLGKLAPDKARFIIEAAEEVSRGELDRHFPISVYQTGSGTSTNMNLNEVISNRAAQKAGKALGSRDILHPNDHVNMGQSSNDTFPTAMHVGAALALKEELGPALDRLRIVLDQYSREWDDVVKAGRTHLMDATPVRMGQVFSGYAQQAANAQARAREALSLLAGSLAIGGTAVGTGINTHVEFGRRVAAELTRTTGIEFRETENHFEAQAAKDAMVDAHARLKTIAVSLSKIANDIRLLGSGPRCGLGELILPGIQPGSSIMPGKVNPVLCESVIQVACRVIGNDAAITLAATGGVGSIFELNTAMPVMGAALIESINLLASATSAFVDKLLTGLQVNRQHCQELVERSLMMVTSLAPRLGYDAAAKLAKEALEKGLTIRELVLQKKLLPPEVIDELLDPRSMTQPGGEGSAGG